MFFLKSKRTLGYITNHLVRHENSCLLLSVALKNISGVADPPSSLLFPVVPHTPMAYRVQQYTHSALTALYLAAVFLFYEARICETHHHVRLSALRSLLLDSLAETILYQIVLSALVSATSLTILD